MNRKFLRFTLAGFILAATIYAAVPGVAHLLGFRSFPDPMTAFAERSVSTGACRDDGVTLVIDYGTDSKRPTAVLCAIHFGDNPANTGWGLFDAANQRVVGTSQYPLGFVCRINGYPSPNAESCEQTPNQKVGTWVYFKAVNSSGWRYSLVGASQDTPTCGSWEGWRFVKEAQTTSSFPRVSPTPFRCS